MKSFRKIKPSNLFFANLQRNSRACAVGKGFFKRLFSNALFATKQTLKNQKIELLLSLSATYNLSADTANRGCPAVNKVSLWGRRKQAFTCLALAHLAC
jgi:hypothetical protein